METRRQTRSPRLRLAADIGGTFTDVAAFDERSRRAQLRQGALHAAPSRRGHHRGRREGRHRLRRRPGCSFTARPSPSTPSWSAPARRRRSIITEGFRDIYEIGRINRPDAYNLFFRKHEPLVERALRFEAKERILADGEIDVALDEERDRRARRRARGARHRGGRDPVSQLLSQPRPRGPRQAHHRGEPSRACSSRPPTSCRRNTASSSAARRWSPTPISGRRCGAISARSTSTSAPPDSAARSWWCSRPAGSTTWSRRKSHCIRMLESGPAAGVIGAQALCRTLKLDNAIAFDMGGTTAKAGVIYKGEPLTTGAALIGGYEQALPIQIAMMDIFEVGTGGGSIARVEDGALHVGPQSAGAQPGPACYGLRRARADRHRRQPACSDALRPTASSAARCRSIPPRRRRRCRPTWRSPSAWASPPPPTASCASPSPPCPMRSRR